MVLQDIKNDEICRNKNRDPNQTTKLVSPDGGWGYIITASLIIYTLITSSLFDSFGLIYGEFLKQITGDEADGITLTFGILMTCQCYSGILAHILFHLISIRKVGLIGAFLYFVGSLSSVFMRNLIEMIICVSLLQGVGSSLITQAMYSSFYSYFKKNANVVMGICQTVLMVGVFSTPYIVEKMVRSLGFRNSLWALTILAIVIFITVGFLHPVEWHLKEVNTRDVEYKTRNMENQRGESAYQEKETTEKLLETGTSQFDSVVNHTDKGKLHTVLRWCSKFVEVSLLKNYIFWSVAIGTSCFFLCDVAFLALLPAVLSDVGISTEETAIMMTVHFALDLVSRICYSILNVIYKTKNRYIHYIGAVITVVFRIVFNLNNSYNWRVWILGILGFFRGLMHVTLTLSITEEFGDKFSSAYSIVFVIGGTLNVIMGSISGYVKQITGDNVYILHTQTLTLFIGIVVFWSVEFLYRRNVIRYCRNKS